ncbi:metalloregulator ArsR/SmtB family transcription factor [Ornithinimicrobium sp. F0845]|uniref:ArsR/SmtB family transcription factor n=1 Tax=Ornithinimicrobium sp. F0845 TaxID=2926412 RepID=UPI001FF4EDF8|nr:metalloregulator ArsR/SmtB family transcription factor [Ornithinimicrobium sp. F0845]MCK0112121.1 metalloregulator ArsR/SmtB family transcription factor [Ornithinimicrobium sp. F0845]
MSQDVFEVIADGTRRRILDLLRSGERPVGELVDLLGVSQPSVSKHLKVLDRAALVRVRVDGPRRHYSVDPAALAEVEAWLAPFRELWADRLDALEHHLDGLESRDAREDARQDERAPSGQTAGDTRHTPCERAER